MFNRKEIKEKGKKNFYKNYFYMVAVSFLLAYLTGYFGYHYDFKYNTDANTVYEQDTYKVFDSVLDDNTNELTKKSIETVVGPVARITDSVINIVSSNYFIAFSLLLGGLIGILYNIFFASPFLVNCYKFFIKNEKEGTKRIGIVLDNFKGGNYLNNVKVMFFKNLYLFFWLFTIVGFFIKQYEYRMIPYLLAEDPKLNKKDAFLKSRHMMMGNKMNAFVLDLSFIGWHILSVFTFGILSVAYVNPYHNAANVELYLELKKQKKK